jgi:hypothetical protein
VAAAENTPVGLEKPFCLKAVYQIVVGGEFAGSENDCELWLDSSCEADCCRINEDDLY